MGWWSSSGGGGSSPPSTEVLAWKGPTPVSATRHTLPPLANTVISGQASVAITANRYYHASWLLVHDITLTSVKGEVTAASASGNIRVGIYNTDDSWLPTSLVSEFGEMPINALGAISIADLSVTLVAGKYMLVWVPQGNCSLRHRQGSIWAGYEVSPGTSAMQTNIFPTYPYRDGSYAALPSTYSGSIVNSAAAGSPFYSSPWLFTWDEA